MNLNEIENKMFNIHQDMITCKTSIFYLNDVFKTADAFTLYYMSIYLEMLKNGEKYLKEQLKNIMLEFDNLMGDLSDEDLKTQLDECICFLNEQCVPNAVVDWREIPRPTPYYWMWVLMKKSPEGYGIKEFINGDCPEEFYVHPIREHEQVELYGSMLNPEKAREAIGFIFNDIKDDWYKRDFRTEEEVEEDNKREIEFLYGDEDNEYYKESSAMYNRMKKRIDGRSEEEKKKIEYYSVRCRRYERASNNIISSVNILKKYIYMDNDSSSDCDIGKALGEIIYEKSRFCNSILMKYRKEESEWYNGIMV
jgi:hypothetical protein